MKRVVRCYIKNGYTTEEGEIIHGMKVTLFGTLDFAILFLHPQKEVLYATGINKMIVVEMSVETQIKRKLLATTDAQRKLNSRKHIELRKQAKTLEKREETLAKHEETYASRRQNLAEDERRFAAHVSKTLAAFKAREWKLDRAEEQKQIGSEEQKQTPKGLDAAIEAESEDEIKESEDEIKDEVSRPTNDEDSAT
ncbi:MAG: hypothetical protein GY938_06385, partial [Ketobacter sp.]|nr:hypothetical protein [Ketobacter sp.]